MKCKRRLAPAPLAMLLFASKLVDQRFATASWILADRC
jgi:hypothetical protein